MQQRLRRRVERAAAADVWTATYVLLGLRYSREVARVLLQGVLGMKESVTYQAIVEEGEIREARQFFLRLGRKRLGAPDEATAAAINAITDVQQFEELGERLFGVSTWQELLAAPMPRRRNGRRQRYR